MSFSLYSGRSFHRAIETTCRALNHPPSHDCGNANTISATGYQCGPYAGPAFQVAIAPARLAANPNAPPTIACAIGRYGARYAVKKLAATPYTTRYAVTNANTRSGTRSPSGGSTPALRNTTSVISVTAIPAAIPARTARMLRPN